MFTLYDNRNQLWQWDINRKVIVEDNTIDQVHFCNRTGDCSLVVEPYYLEGNVYVADIPNILLQNDYPIKVYAYLSDGYTKVEECLKVRTRSKPSDYIYTETEVITVQTIEKRMDELEDSFNANINQTVSDYLDNNPVKVDLSNYYNKEETDNKITEVVNAIPEVDLTDYATKEYVAETIAGVDIPEVDLSGYYTKEETYNQEQVDAAIYNSRDSYYLDFSNATATERLPATADMIEFITRYLDNKNVCAHIRLNKAGAWETADVRGSGASGIHFTTSAMNPAAINQNSNTSYKSIVVEEVGGEWGYRIYQSYSFALATKEYVDNAVANIDIPDSARSVYYLDFSSATTEWQDAPAEMGEFVTRAAANHDVFAYISEKGTTWHFAQIKGLSETSIILQIASITPNRSRVEKYYAYNITKNNDVWQYRITDIYSFQLATADYVNTAIANINIPDTYTKEDIDALHTPIVLNSGDNTTAIEFLETLQTAMDNGTPVYWMDDNCICVLAGFDVITQVAYFHNPTTNMYISATVTDGQLVINHIPDTTGNGNGGGGVKIIRIPSTSSGYTTELTAELWQYLNEYYNNRPDGSPTVPDSVVFYIQSLSMPSCWVTASTVSGSISQYGNYLMLSGFEAKEEKYCHQYTIYFNSNGSFQRLQTNYSAVVPESSGGSEWKFTNNYSDLYNAKEVYLCYYSNVDGIGNCYLYSHVVLNNDVLGNKQYNYFPITSPHSLDNQVSFWYYNGSDINFQNTYSGYLEWIAYKE